MMKLTQWDTAIVPTKKDDPFTIAAEIFHADGRGGRTTQAEIDDRNRRRRTDEEFLRRMSDESERARYERSRRSEQAKSRFLNGDWDALNYIDPYDTIRLPNYDDRTMGWVDYRAEDRMFERPRRSEPYEITAGRLREMRDALGRFDLYRMEDALKEFEKIEAQRAAEWEARKKAAMNDPILTELYGDARVKVNRKNGHIAMSMTKEALAAVTLAVEARFEENRTKIKAAEKASRSGSLAGEADIYRTKEEQVLLELAMRRFSDILTGRET